MLDSSTIATMLARRAVKPWSMSALIAVMVVGAAVGQALPQSTIGRVRGVTAVIDGSAIQANAGKTENWLSYGLDYSESRFSRLKGINDGNVAKLGLIWSYDLNSTRGVEATPLVVDGVMYVTSSWSVVHAIEVRTGKAIWTYDPMVDRGIANKGCCDVVNRGVALYKGKVFVGAFDGRLIAIDAATGRKSWEVDTVLDHSHAYTITGAPRIVKGNVVIGQGGADLGARGYVTAYDGETGEQKWRWFVVPGDPSKPFEDESMAMAAKTWDASGRYWVNGGGGTPWDSIVFDPELNLLYIGTGNGGPWSRNLRSPAGGDNLFLASIVALDADTGKYVWHYQETPGESWDYTSTQPMILAYLKIKGSLRKVILHAPKNGFFFVIDRINGEFISARNFVDVNWASGYDVKGRPIEIAEARSKDRAYDSIPGPVGAHNWQPMSFNPVTGLVYLPAQNVPRTLKDNPQWTYKPESWNTAMFVDAVPPRSKPFGRLIAWDPVRQKEAWRHEYVGPWNGGTLTTAGNLVFQGTADGRFVAFNATTGQKLWQSPTGTGVVAGPVTYLVDGVQYVSVAAGWGGVYGLTERATDHKVPGTVYTFAIGGKAALPKFVEYSVGNLISGVKYEPSDVKPGQFLYYTNCYSCHGIPGISGGGNIGNLGYVPAAQIEHLEAIVLGGTYKNAGMPDFVGRLNAGDVRRIKAYIQGTADAIRARTTVQ